MYEQAQRLLIMKDYAGALAQAETFLSQSGSSQATVLALKGNALYRLQRLPEAEAALKAAIAAKPEQASDWTYLLIQIYTEQGKTEEAAQLASTLSGSTSSDRAAQLNLAATYFNGNQLDKAAEVIGRLRQAGQLQEESDYMTALMVYLKMEDREEDIIAVATEGLEKGALKETAQVMNILAEAYYYSDQIDPAIDAWKRAAPLARDGSSYLNLAIVLNGEQRFAEAKAAAMSALDKGLGKPGDAWRQIADAEDGLGNAAAAAAARSKAGR
jgi:tetratricopeptide (TPR) repeat protein